MQTAAHYSWSEAKVDVSNRVSKPLELLKQGKMQTQAKVKEEIPLTLEKPDHVGHEGTSTTVSTARVMLNTSNMSLLTEGIANIEVKSGIDSIILNMAVILSIINSSKNVELAEYKGFCRTTSHLVKSVPWIEITPSAHIVLAHSAELIEENDSIGLLNFTESDIEANNKYLRQYRINYARKASQYDNISDCINRL